MRNRGAFPLFMGISMLLFLGAVAYGGAPTPSPEKPAGNYQGPIAERPSHESGDYWIYVRPGGDRFRLESGNILWKVEFPLRVGGIWKYRSGALQEGQPQTSKATRITTEIACEATAFKTITVTAGSFEAFECRCECNVIGGRSVWERNCGEWTLWYAPQVKNVIKTKTESTADTFELADYNIRGHLAQPKTAQDFYNRGLSYRRKKEYDRAIQDFDEAIRLNSNYADAFNSRGLAYADKKDYDRAIQDYNEALRLNPNHAFAYNNRGNAHLDKKQTDLAIADYDRSIANDPNDFIAHYNRARAYSAKKDPARELQDYDAAIRINPKYAAALNNRGNIYRAKKDYDRAIRDYEEAIRSNPNYALAYNNRGHAYHSKGNYELAMADYKAAARIDPKLAQHRNMGYTHFYLGRMAESAEAMEQRLKTVPQDKYAMLWRYLSVARREGLQPASQELDKNAVRLEDHNWPAAVIDYYLGKADEKSMYAAADNPDEKKRNERTCEANFYAAQARLLKKATEEAIPLLRAAAKDCVNLHEAHAARAELNRLGQ